jgi:two-component system cell cycle sensor histidine kinase/response regulator CckA
MENEGQLNLNIINALEESVVILSKDLHILEANRATEKLLGLPKKEILGKRCFELFHGRDDPPENCPCSAAQKGNKGIYGEIQEPHLGNRWFQLYINPLPNSKMIHVLRDITPCKDMEKHLKEKKEKHKALLDNALAPIYETTPKGELIYANPAFVRAFGYTSFRKIKDINVSQLWCYPEKRQGFKETMAQDGKVNAIEIKLKDRWGKPFWVVASGIAVRDDTGKVVRYRGTFINITRIKEAEEKLKESEKRYRELFQESAAGIFRTTPDGEILMLNPRFLEILGYRDFTEIKHLKVAQDVYYIPEDREAFKKHLESRGKLEGYEIQLKRKDGSPVWVKMYAKVHYDQDEKPCYYHGTVINITKQKELENQLRQSQKMEAIARLVGEIAHDFNNILTTIIGNMELARMSSEHPEAVQSYLDKAKRSSDKATQLISRLLSFNKPRTSSKELIDLNDLVQSVLDVFHRTIREDIKVITRLNPQSPLVTADPLQMEQVLINLVANAVDAMPQGGTLTIYTARVQTESSDSPHETLVPTGFYGLLSVSDTGIGMDQDVQEKIFEPFFTTKPVNKESGLGLSMVYGIVRHHGGYIEVRSKVGKGSTFNVFIPEAPNKQRHLQVIPPKKATITKGKGTILLVEDQGELREVLTAFLGELGYEVLEALDGKEGLERFQEHVDRINLIISDIVMPKMSGTQLVQTAQAHNPSIKALLISGYGGEHVTEEIERLYPIMQKPFTLREIAHKVEEILEG